MSYITLFVISFLAATILPLSSEITLAGLMAVQSYNNFILLLAASVGNILGSSFNWVLGIYSRKFDSKKVIKILKMKSLKKLLNTLRN